MRVVLLALLLSYLTGCGSPPEKITDIPWMPGLRMLLFSVLLVGCNYTVDHNIKLDLGLKDECLRCFPECRASGGTMCVDGDGSICAECATTCIGAAALICGPGAEQPLCTQTVGAADDPDLFYVPVVCLSDE